MEFGAPKRREASSNKDKYDNIAVLTVSAFKGKGTARALILNNNAIAALGINFDAIAADGVNKVDAMISFSFDAIKETITLANTSGLEGVSGVRLAKTSKSAADKSYFDAIKKHYGVAVEDEVEILLTPNDFEFNGNITMNLSLLTATAKLETVVEEAVAVTEPEALPAVSEVAEPVAAPVLENIGAPTNEIQDIEELASPSLEDPALPAFEATEDVYEGFNV